jgi:hypothetical protein
MADLVPYTVGGCLKAFQTRLLVYFRAEGLVSQRPLKQQESCQRVRIADPCIFLRRPAKENTGEVGKTLVQSICKWRLRALS